MEKLSLICSISWVAILLYRIINKHKKPTSAPVLNTYIVLSGLILLFFDTVYYFSCVFPVTDISKLTPSDWLAFWGSYLGFSGSLLMAYIVYKQDSIINQLILKEYKTTLDFEFLSADICKSYDSTLRNNVIVSGTSGLYIKHDLCPQNHQWILPISDIPYILTKITNIGKTAATKLTLESIRVSPMNHDKDIHEYHFENSQMGGNILNGKYVLDTGSSINCAFYLHAFIRNEGNYSCLLKFSYYVDGICFTDEYSFVILVKRHQAYLEYRFLNAKTQPMCRLID